MLIRIPRKIPAGAHHQPRRQGRRQWARRVTYRRAMGYCSPYSANKDTAAQINIHNPSENNRTKVSASPGINLRIGSLPEQTAGDGSCEPRKEAKDQTRWNPAFLSNCSSQPRRKTACSLRHATSSGVPPAMWFLGYAARGIGSARSASDHGEVRLFTRCAPGRQAKLD